MIAVWTDTTTYSRGEPDRTPREWSLGHTGLRIHRLLHAEGWFVSWHRVGIERMPLRASDVDTAKVEAIHAAHAYLAAAIAALDAGADARVDEARGK